MRTGTPAAALLAAIALATAACSTATQAASPTITRAPAASPAPAAATLPRPAHVVVVIMENHAYSDIIGNTDAPYLNSLAAQGASFSRSYAVTHPSEPNYLALFSGSTTGLDDDSCPHTFTGPNLASELDAAGYSFAGYSESMPATGYTGCAAGPYARKHNPWVDFTNVPAADNRTFADFPSDYTKLPTVAFVVPNLNNDMHDGTVNQGDAWLRAHIDGYARWARAHDSELIITWDEDDDSSGNQIPTIITGAGIRPGVYPEQISHYSVLRTLEALYRLPAAAQSAATAPISDIFTG